MNYYDTKFSEAVAERNFENIEKCFTLASRDLLRQYMTAAGFTPLHSASSPEAVKQWISSGIDVNLRNPVTDETPLLTAIKLNVPPSVVRELLKQGAAIEVRNKHTLNTPLNQAVLTNKCRPENVQALLEYGADPNTVNKYGLTPLENACEYLSFLNSEVQNLRIVEQLLKCGANVNNKNPKGLTPLNIALRNLSCRVELVDLLFKFSARVDIEDIITAMRRGGNHFLKIVDLLLQHACITSRDDWKRILKLVLFNRENAQDIKKRGMLVIKHLFLQCDDPHQILISFLSEFKNFVTGPVLYTNRQLRENMRFELRFRQRLQARGQLVEPASFNLSSVPLLHDRQLCRLCLLRKRKTASTFDDSLIQAQTFNQDCPTAQLNEVDNLKSFSDSCFLEIERMKVDEMENNISIYRIIASKTPKVCPDNKILKVLEENLYPIYSDIIVNKIKESFRIDKLILPEVHTVVQQGDIARRIVLDTYCVSSIVQYLDEDEIRSFVYAYSDPSKGEYYFWNKLVKIEASLTGKTSMFKLSFL